MHRYLIRFVIDGTISLAAVAAARILNDLKNEISSTKTHVTFNDFENKNEHEYQAEISFKSNSELIEIARYFKDAIWSKPSECQYILAAKGYPKFDIKKMSISQGWEVISKNDNKSLSASG